MQILNIKKRFLLKLKGTHSIFQSLWTPFTVVSQKFVQMRRDSPIQDDFCSFKENKRNLYVKKRLLLMTFFVVRAHQNHYH